MKRRGRLFLAGAAALAVVAGAYSNHFHNAFHFDDAHVIETNLWLRDLSNIPRFFGDASTFSSDPEHATYRPLVSTTLAVDYAVAGGLGDTVPFHVTQLLLHLAVAAAAFALYRRAFPPAGSAASWLALGGAAWFAVHTANTETVNYLSARSDILSTLGLLLAFLLYLRGGVARRWHLYLLPMVIGALAKPPALVFAPLLGVWVWLFETDDARGCARLRQAAAVSAPAFLVAAATFVFVEAMNPAAQTYGGESPLTYLLTQAWVWVHYLRLFVLPVGLTADSDLSLLAWYDTRVLLGGAVILGMALVAVGAARRPRGRPIAFGLAWAAIGLAPTSSIIPLAEVANEHRLYLPFVGLVMAAVWAAFLVAEGVARAWEARPTGVAKRPATPLPVALVLVIAVHAAGTHVRNRVWATGETLWADAVEKSPGNGRAWMNYGLTQMEAGRLEEAEALFQHAVTLIPRYPHLQTNLGIVTSALGRPGEAEGYFRGAVELDPDFAEGRYYFARWLLEQGRGPEALEQLAQAAAISPAHVHVRSLTADLRVALGDAPFDGEETAANATDPYNQGVAFTEEEQHLEAALQYRRSLRDGPTADAYNNLGWSLAQLGFRAEGADAFREALRLEPDHPRAAANLAWVLGEATGEGG